MGTYWPWSWGLCAHVCWVTSVMSISVILWTVDGQAPLSMGFFRQEHEWVVMLSSRVYFLPRDQTHIACHSCIAGGFLTTEPLGKPRVEGSVHSVTQSLIRVHSLQPYEPQHARPPCHHQLPEFTQTLVYWVSDAIQSSHPLSPFPPPLNPSQHQGLFKWVSSLYQVAKL